MQVCTSLQTDNHASTPPLKLLQTGCPSCRLTNSDNALKVTQRPYKIVQLNAVDRNGVYSRYSSCDWDAAAKTQVSLADRESHRAQRLDKRSWEIVHGLEQRMRNRQCSNTKKLGIHSRVRSLIYSTDPIYKISYDLS